ncbi:methyltransferase [Streptomyces carminius]|uniref:Protein-L-isoaspartate O-methyltransferase n=1 Tax=Streptomyces carminius TaxID=2665496 RepID=A0A2M8LQH6_9ACTN|nr:methyltransferase domain-containing protein [Streptomyces carminius]PJE94198.1 methyltransferase [Streptomyces carminius]
MTGETDGRGKRGGRGGEFRDRARSLARALVRGIEAEGLLADPAWRAAFEAVPRHLFVPCYYLPLVGGYERLGRDDPDPSVRERWLTGVYEDVPLATRVRDGEPRSSSSQPSLMAMMLRDLRVADGMDVLEIGTGTGWNAALLAHRLGDAHVTTVDVDPEITGEARTRLAAAGRHLEVVTGDGALGCPERGPYDRIIGTCAVDAVPPAWPEQCRPGAVILTPMATGLLALRVTEPGRAEGRFLPDPAYFVPLRGDRPPRPRIDPADLPREALRTESFGFLLSLTGGGPDPGAAYERWRRAGRPDRTRYGVTVRGADQWVWLDDPDGPDRWPLRAGPGTGPAPGVSPGTG